MIINQTWDALWKFRMETVFNVSWYSFLHEIVDLLVNSRAKGQQKREAVAYGDVIFPTGPIHNDCIMHPKGIVNING